MISLDAIDRRILEQLQHDGRLSNADLAEKVGLSSSPCWRRVKALEEAIAGCSWLDSRKATLGSVVAPYFWSCLFHGERKGIDLGVFKAALRQAGELTPRQTEKYFALGCRQTIAEVDCSGWSCPSSDISMPILSAPSSARSCAWSSRLGQAG